MNPEYYIILPDDVASGPYDSAEEARRNVDSWHHKRGAGGVKIARVLAVSSTQATYKVDWNRPYDLGERLAIDDIADSEVVE
jgi:hypothetical protein